MTQAIDSALAGSATRSRGALSEIARARRDLIESGEAGAIPAFDAPIRREDPQAPRVEPRATPLENPAGESRGERAGTGVGERASAGVPDADGADSRTSVQRGEGEAGASPAKDAARAVLAERSEAPGASIADRTGVAGAHARGADAGVLLARLGGIASSAGGNVAGRSGGTPGAINAVGAGRVATAVRATYQKAAAPAPRTERDALIEQIQRGLAQALRQGEGELTIRLRPEHLGLVRMRVSVVAEQVTATIEASSERARDLLGSELRTLREALEARGLSVDRIIVEHDEKASRERESPRERDADDASNRGRSPMRHDPGAERGGEVLATMRVEARSWDGRVDTLA